MEVLLNASFRQSMLMVQPFHYINMFTVAQAVTLESSLVSASSPEKTSNPAKFKPTEKKCEFGTLHLDGLPDGFEV